MRPPAATSPTWEEAIGNAMTFARLYGVRYRVRSIAYRWLPGHRWVAIPAELEPMP